MYAEKVKDAETGHGRASSLAEVSTIDTVLDSAKAANVGHERTVGIQLPPGAETSPHPRVPIAYRTLSIHVYDSQRFEPSPSIPSTTSRGFWPFRRRSQGTGTDEDDAKFFGKLDFHSVSAHDVCQRFNVSPSSGLDGSSAAKRLTRNGPNVLVQRKPQYWKKMLRYLFGDFCSILWVGESTHRVHRTDAHAKVSSFSSSRGSRSATPRRRTISPWRSS